jgi:hypothetical protein
MPAIAVKGNSHEEFFGRNAGCEVGLDGVGDCAAAVVGACGKRSDEAGGFVPWAAHVIGHEADAVDEAADLGHVGAFVAVGTCSDGNVEKKAWTDGVHLSSELFEERDIVGGVRLMGVLPIEVDTVEETGDGDSGGELAFEEGVDAGGDEGCAVCGLGVVGEVGGVSLEGDENAEIGEFEFELLKLMEVSTKGLSEGVGRAIDALLGGKAVVEVGVGVSDGAVAVGDEALGVVDLID